MKTLLTLFCILVIVSAVHAAEPLKLTDGRVLKDWKIISQSDDAVTVRFAGGAAKVMKTLLPPEVLAQYPIVEASPTVEPAAVAPEPQPVAAAPEPLPPEPDGLDKSVKAQRSIVSEEKYTGKKFIWRGYVGQLAPLSFTVSKSSMAKNSSEYKTQYILVYHPNQWVEVDAMLTKAQNWAAAVREKKPPAFEKELGFMGSNIWKFQWSGYKLEIFTGQEYIEIDDIDNIRRLVLASPYIAVEEFEKQKAALEFANGLK